MKLFEFKSYISNTLILILILSLMDKMISINKLKVVPVAFFQSPSKASAQCE